MTVFSFFWLSRKESSSSYTFFSPNSASVSWRSFFEIVSWILSSSLFTFSSSEWSRSSSKETPSRRLESDLACSLSSWIACSLSLVACSASWSAAVASLTSRLASHTLYPACRCVQSGQFPSHSFHLLLRFDAPVQPTPLPQVRSHLPRHATPSCRPRRTVRRWRLFQENSAGTPTPHRAREGGVPWSPWTSARGLFNCML